MSLLRASAASAFRSHRRHDGHSVNSIFGPRSAPPPRRAFGGWVLSPAHREPVSPRGTALL